MTENGNGTDTDIDPDIQLPAEHVASLDEVEDAHRCLYIKDGNGYALRPTVAADFRRMHQEYRIAQLVHESETLRLQNEVLTERCWRLEREAASAAGRPEPQAQLPEPENSFAKQLARLKTGIAH